MRSVDIAGNSSVCYGVEPFSRIPTQNTTVNTRSNVRDMSENSCRAGSHRHPGSTWADYSARRLLTRRVAETYARDSVTAPGTKDGTKVGTDMGPTAPVVLTSAYAQVWARILPGSLCGRKAREYCLTLNEAFFAVWSISCACLKSRYFDYARSKSFFRCGLVCVAWTADNICLVCMLYEHTDVCLK